MPDFYVEVTYHGNRTYIVTAKDEEEARRKVVEGDYKSIEEDDGGTFDDTDIDSVEEIEE